MTSAAAPARAQVPPEEPIAFIDLGAQRRRIAREIDGAIAAVLEQGAYISGPQVREFERALAAFAGAKNAISCSNGTEALLLVLRALGIGSGDAVFVPAFTFAATAEVVALTGATPVFVDVDATTFNMDPGSLAAAVDATLREGRLAPRAVIPVDLFGQPADYRAVGTLAAQADLFVLADAAQSFGACFNNRRVGTLAPATTTSFFPAKPLGCYGDGGAILTDDDELAALLRSLCVHGKGVDKYDNVRIGTNARLDTLQAAILLEKLKIFPDEVEARAGVARRYAEGLGDIVQVPRLIPGASSVWAQYTLVLRERDQVQAALKAQGIPTQIYYPRPLNRQTAYRAFPSAPGGTSVSDRLSMSVLSLPMHPYLKPDVQDRIIAAVRNAVTV
jgi:dTDP-4-amino-4,6-dideoxygalactose transaminase